MESAEQLKIKIAELDHKLKMAHKNHLKYMRKYNAKTIKPNEAEPEYTIILISNHPKP